MAGLFDYQSPENMRATRLQPLLVSGAQMGQQPLLSQLVSQMSNAGANIGATGASMLGLQLPEEARQQQVQGIMKGVDLTNPESIMKGADMFTQMGDSARAMALTEQADIVGQRQVAQEDRVAKQAAATKTEATRVQGSQMLATKLGVTSEQARLLIDTDPKAAVALMNPEVKTETVTANKRVQLINSQTGAVIADLGAAADTSPTITNVLDPGGMKKFGGDVQAFQKAVDPFLKTYHSAQTAKHSVNLALKSNNNTAWESARTQIARAAGEGKLSNADIERVGSTPEIVQRLKNVFAGWTTGIPDEKTMKDLYSYASLLEKINKGKVNNEADRWRKLANEDGDISQERLNMLIPKVGESNTVSWDSLPE